jgi:hypothetical protein
VRGLYVLAPKRSSESLDRLVGVAQAAKPSGMQATQARVIALICQPDLCPFPEALIILSNLKLERSGNMVALNSHPFQGIEIDYYTKLLLFCL